MELMMYVGNDCIDILPVENSFIHRPGYLGQFVRRLRQEHESLILEKNTEPEFFLRNASFEQKHSVIPISSSLLQRNNFQIAV
jgi:hypothetical protein